MTVLLAELLSVGDPLAVADPLVVGDPLAGVLLDGALRCTESSRTADFGRLEQAPLRIGGGPPSRIVAVAANAAGLALSRTNPVNAPSATGRTTRDLPVVTDKTSPS